MRSDRVAGVGVGGVAVTVVVVDVNVGIWIGRGRQGKPFDQTLKYISFEMLMLKAAD